MYGTCTISSKGRLFWRPGRVNTKASLWEIIHIYYKKVTITYWFTFICLNNVTFVEPRKSNCFSFKTLIFLLPRGGNPPLPAATLRGTEIRSMIRAKVLQQLEIATTDIYKQSRWCRSHYIPPVKHFLDRCLSHCITALQPPSHGGPTWTCGLQGVSLTLQSCENGMQIRQGTSHLLAFRWSSTLWLNLLTAPPCYTTKGLSAPMWSTQFIPHWKPIEGGCLNILHTA